MTETLSYIRGQAKQCFPADALSATGNSPLAAPSNHDHDTLVLIDQTRLPADFVTVECGTVEQVFDAIVRLVVRGAPAIGIAAGYGVCLARDADGNRSPMAYLEAIDRLAGSRPTAVNLFWALERMRTVVESVGAGDGLHHRLVAEAIAIHDEDRQMCKAMGRHGASLLSECESVMTHCNAGGLAASMWGTALAPIYHLHQSGHTLNVFADETRPLLQGARLTAWELSQAGIPVTVLTDSMAGSLLRTGRIDAAIVGADRIAANGDVANKIGTYPLAVLASYHNVPFYVAAPSSTFDPKLASGDLIPIEQRHRDEVARPYGVPLVPDAAKVINPAFDVTPAELVTALISERGVVRHPNREKLAKHFEQA
ncbi:S-methyl-5-thioribose-1-phosphate isomerase [Novipirellula artificiosorum]|uniref:Methylthioribose-1-phosphate isomerase n=1 Tax=Novipirellula artificiosorum TaxID=2528016 RepID=A0A5C6E2W9_9BACT|nr:S-methyl-5-thioribose-1-phosphate isomerase [Novipirellula artificiosorum]TWU42844.1 Methylthioribose-1-phosphate isomerase [Novipirellula artificiosorum]